MTDDTGVVGVGGGGVDDHAFLSGYLDGELTVGERADVEARLAASSELRAELDEVRAVRDAVRALPRRDAPVGFWDAVVANVEGTAESDSGDDLAPVRDISEPRARTVPWRWIAGAAAAAAVVIAVFVVPGRTQIRPNVTAVATQHGAASSDMGDSISPLATISPLVRRR